MVEEQKRTVPLSDYVALQQLKQNARNFYFAAWNADVVSVEEDRRKTSEIAAAIAQSTLKTGALLNGGAIIALPALKGLLGNGVSGAAIVAAVSMFVIGLVCNAVASTWAYQSVGSTLNKLDHLREQRALKRNIPDAEDDEKRAEMQETLVQENLNLEGALARANRYGGRALIAHWLSLAAFVIGAFVGVVALLGLI